MSRRKPSIPDNTETTVDRLEVGDTFCTATDYTPKPNSGVGFYEVINIVAFRDDDPQKLSFTAHYYVECKTLYRDGGGDDNNQVRPLVRFYLPPSSLWELFRTVNGVLKLSSGGAQKPVNKKSSNEKKEDSATVLKRQGNFNMPENNQPKIISASISPMPKPTDVFGQMPTVTAAFDDGFTRDLFCFYPDEISFTESEFVGLTETEARELRHNREVAFLQAA